MLSKIIRRARLKRMKYIDYRGLRVPIHGPHAIRPIKEELYLDRYEVPEITALTAMLRPGDRVLEIGAGMGVVSGLAAKAMPDVQIESYEGNPNLITAIKELHRLNAIGNITLHNRILVPGPAEGERVFHLHWSFAESSLVATDETREAVRVPTESLPDKLARFSPHLLVVDIEGGEEELLPDIDLGDLRGLILELHPKVNGPDAEKRITDNCLKAGLEPRKDLSTAQVVAFERPE